MRLGQLTTGIILTFSGVILVAVSFTVFIWALVYGIPLLILGIVILLNKNEDKIEKIKTQDSFK